MTPVTWVTQQMACVTTFWPQWTATFLSTGVRYEPRIKGWVNDLSTVASVLAWTIFLAVFVPTLWTENTATVNTLLSYIT